ncbi:hypothetical protein BOTCAL_0001g00690 [Botryotinia calthae]|uniref:DUF7892 domain-containing protein n=1 Tax=Botryotinia calthae TaxID=38488 RepID=A0A4Y8DKT5_9HELO|nr:hypothetical protein BOTCAL_0001g00690 [Botryotinia calthae]
MDTPGSDIPSGSTGISATDTSTATSPKPTISNVSPDTGSSNNHIISIIENDDSASDVSMSADSEDEDEDTLDNLAIQSNSRAQLPEKTNGPMLQSSQPETSRKRKYLESREDHTNGRIDNIKALEEMRKRLKPDEIQDRWRSEGQLPLNRSVLPAEIWHHIFTFTAPKTLGNLLQVNKSFNKYLDPSSDSTIVPLSKSSVQVLKPDAIWRASRRYFQPLMPVPLVGQTELDMWRICCSNACQFCSKKNSIASIVQSDQWHLGPGENGVIPIWPFAVRSCGICLLQHAIKEIDVLLSSSIPSPLMPALPFVFLTNELHVIPATALQNGQPPPTTQITKYYLKKHIEEIKDEFESVKAMGSATIEEWLKGLEDRGKERRNDSARWERWEANGGIIRIKASDQHNPSKQIPAAIASSTDLIPTKGQQVLINSGPKLPNHTPDTHSLPQIPKSLPAIHTSFPANIPVPRYDSPSQSIYSAYTPRSNLQPKHERTKEEVADLKATRRTEIERRSLLLDPPLTASVLAHMSSFQAAIQIIQPLNDGAWEVLKPRLLSQREEAEQRENDRITQFQVIEERHFKDIQAKPEYKEAIDREWDDAQAPLRARIGAYADETIRSGWNGGDKVTKESSPKFAADVLIYVRKRFYAEIAKDDAAVRATGQEPPSDPPLGPYTRKLTLENMKWVFDTKIKPLTEQYNKDLFLCNVCDNNFKYYGFEGVVQHFAAKHTTSLSFGSIVVHWKSEWPEYPPFCPDPIARVRTVFPNFPGPSATAPYAGSAPSIPPHSGYAAYQQLASAAPNSNVYQDPYYGHSQYGDQHVPPPPGPYAPQQMYQDQNQGYSQYTAQPLSAITPGYSDHIQNYSQSGYGGSYSTPTQPGYTSLPPNQMYPAPIPDSNVQPLSYVSHNAQHTPSYNQPPVYTNGNYSQMSASAPQQAQPQASPLPQKTEEYKAQLRQLGHDARTIWDSITGVKEVPGSVKAHTILFHILKRFRSKFGQDPPLSMIVDGLSNNKDMRPVRNINGLLCRACVLGMAGSVTSSKPDRKHFSFPQLTIHFRTIHEEGVPSNLIGHFPDWTKDMVELPDQAKISSLATAPGMEGRKLETFLEALPEIAAAPPRKDTMSQRTSPWQPKAEPLDQETSLWQQAPYVGQETTVSLAPSQDSHEKYYATVADTRTPDTESVSVTYNNNPYDPRHPRGAQKLQSSCNSTSIAVSSRHEQDGQLIHDEIVNVRRPTKSTSPLVSYSRPEESHSRRIAHDEAPIYLDRNTRYREANDAEHRPRYERTIKSYDDLATPIREYPTANSQSHKLHRQEQASSNPSSVAKNLLETRYRPLEDATSQQTRIFDVVAQISQQAQQARGKQITIREGPVEIGSEDGELQKDTIAQASYKRPLDEATNEAERFLGSLQPEKRPDAVSQRVQQPMRHREDYIEPKWEAIRTDSVRQRRPLSSEPQQRFREVYDDGPVVSGRLTHVPSEQGSYNGYYTQERPPQARQVRAYATNDHYMDPVSGQPFARERSPEILDRRYASNVIYRDERQGSHGAHRTPSRYARYESVRLDNDRARSRSPVYVKSGAQAGQYAERSPEPHLSRQEPIYRIRTPKEEIIYERAPRQEYYRVYADEPRPRQTYEYIQYDSQGPYIIHRPARREHETIYAAYEGEPLSMQPLYEARSTVGHTDPAYYEEYDPRHPEPPPAAAEAREVRYQ